MVSALCSCLGADYIVFSRLKAEKMAVGFIGKGFGASLEVMLVSRGNSEVVWGGSGEFKRGGMLGLARLTIRRRLTNWSIYHFQNYKISFVSVQR